MISSKNIGYHTRLWTDNTVKVVGGSFGGQLDMETANRLTRLFTVVVKPSGSCVFVDREGRDVMLYITVDAAKTDIGLEALKKWHVERRRLAQEELTRQEQQQEEVEDAMVGLTHAEVIRRLKGNT